MVCFSNIVSLSSGWESAYSTVTSRKYYWNKPIEIIYPSIVNFTNWYSTSSTFYNTTIKDWLSNNFPANQYTENQRFDVSVNLFQQLPYTFDFNRSYYENCYVYSSETIRCQHCGIGDVKCNWADKAGEDRHIPSCNFCEQCNMQADTRSATVACTNTSSGGSMSLSYSKSFSDGSIARLVKVSYKNNGNVWTTL